MSPRHWIVAILVGAWLPCAAMGTTFSAGIENSRWLLSDSIFACTLTHPVPGYGEAVFHHRAGESLRFFLQPVRNPMRAGQAALVIEQPAWKAGKSVDDLGYVRVEGDHSRPVELSSGTSERLLASLRDGRMPTFTRRARQSNRPVRVRLNHINYRSPHQSFRRCQTQLLPVNYDQVQRTVVLFDLDRSELSADAKERLGEVALYVNADDRVKQVYVDGHTDSIGTPLRNRELSKARAEAVAGYLKDQGVGDDKLVTRFHGDRYPVAGVETPGPRHRRATVRLEREKDESDAEPVVTQAKRDDIVVVD
ncbi:OmpA family protein [Salicola sp. Rm-C-2C1-2]|uniref:flagellar protein MotY n=1 Tax=Salicola sp. Rm-C-2C1-2 TaxID=3141321 RepID=UPI0032E4FA44